MSTRTKGGPSKYPTWTLVDIFPTMYVCLSVHVVCECPLILKFVCYFCVTLKAKNRDLTTKSRVIAIDEEGFGELSFDWLRTLTENYSLRNPQKCRKTEILKADEPDSCIITVHLSKVPEKTSQECPRFLEIMSCFLKLSHFKHCK